MDGVSESRVFSGSILYLLRPYAENIDGQSRNGRHNKAVKVIDVFGKDTMKIIWVTI